MVIEMTIEQLKCPAVREWTKANRHIPKEQKLNEFHKWFAKNIDLINESVKNNIDKINESFELGEQRAQMIKESVDDDDDFDWGDDGDDTVEQPVNDTNDTNDTQVDKKSSNSKFDEHSEEVTISGKLILTDSKKNKKTNIFSCINSFIKEMEEDGTIEDENSHIWGSLDVSNVTNMTALFAFANITNADLSSWNTGEVKLMEGMFYKSSFNNDSICNWDVRSCENFIRMFTLCDFNQTLKWTYKEIETPALDNFGKTIKINGKPKMIKTTVTPPLIGANANEEEEFIHKFWKDELDKLKNKANAEITETKMFKNMKYIVDYETFINEGFGDFIKKGFNKIKSLFKNMTMKIDNFIAGFNNNGEIIDASSPYTALNYISNGEVEGVRAYSKVKNEFINDNVQSIGSLIQSPEYYGIVDKNSIEYKNYLTMVDMVNEHCSKYGDMLLEDVDYSDETRRIGFSGDNAGLLDSRDINSKKLKLYLGDLLLNTPADKGTEFSKPILIWGAPGIGKSTIPNAIINAWNETHDKKKCLMVIECGNLTVDGFSLPMPTTKKIGKYMKEQPFATQGVINDVKKIEKAIEDIEIQISDDVVKSWLPVYKETNDRVLNKLGNAFANGGIISEMVKNEETGEFEEIRTETTEGGLLLFDEFFRANAQVFKILMQILLNRSFNGKYKIGDKWAIMACSNRPADDDEVKDGYDTTGAVVGTRFGRQFNFIPDFDEWKKWAIKHGHFDEGTIAFLTLTVDAETDEYTNWHTIRPKQYKKGKSGWPTPRTWSNLMIDLNNYKINHKYQNISEIPQDIIEDYAAGAVGSKMGEVYAEFIKQYYSSNLNCSEVFDDPEYELPDIRVQELIGRLKGYFDFAFDETNIPSDTQLTNMFNKLETIQGSKNIKKSLYTHILEKLGIYKDPTSFLKNFKEFIRTFAKTYHLLQKGEDGKVNTSKTLEAIQNFCKGEIMD